MRNVMLFVLILIVGVIGFQLAAPYLESQGVDMNRTAIEDTNVENN